MRRKVIAHILFDVTTLKSWESGPGDDAAQSTHEAVSYLRLRLLILFAGHVK